MRTVVTQIIVPGALKIGSVKLYYYWALSEEKSIEGEGKTVNTVYKYMIFTIYDLQHRSVPYKAVFASNDIKQ